MLKVGLAALAAAALLLVVTSFGQALTLEESGATAVRIGGQIFNDANQNGVKDTSEQGTPGRFVLLDGKGGSYAITNDSGLYQFPAVSPGPHTISVDEIEGKGQCADRFFSFDPMSTSFCINYYELPWHSTTANPTSFTVGSNAITDVDIGIAPDDVAVVTGIALIDSGRTPAGTLIEALVDQTVCGSTATKSGGEVDFVITINGSNEQQGCALPEAAVTFRVGGVVADETYHYRTFGDLPEYDGGLQEQGLGAITSHAWFWFERHSAPGSRDDVLVEALVGPNVCGQANVQMAFGLIGFSRLLVSSSDELVGCGTEGAQVTFRINGLFARSSAVWKTSVQEVDLEVGGDPNCDLAVDPRDATLVLQYVASLLSSPACDADADQDADIDAFDALDILQYAAGLRVGLG